jgi:hypothetical protein
MRLADLTPLGDVPDVTLVSLQKGAAQAQIFEYRGRGPLLDLGKEISDYADTAAIIENLDVLITVDTSVAHLAGAMGEPTWLMLPFAPDWRWLLKRSDSPWYPTLHLFRQPKPSRWDLVVSKIKRELARGFTVGSSPRERLKRDAILDACCLIWRTSQQRDCGCCFFVRKPDRARCRRPCRRVSFSTASQLRDGQSRASPRSPGQRERISECANFRLVPSARTANRLLLLPLRRTIAPAAAALSHMYDAADDTPVVYPLDFRTSVGR